MSELLNKRNTDSAFATIKLQNEMIFEQKKRIDGLNNKLSEILTRLDYVELYIREQRIKNMGSGPTSR